MKFPLEKVFLGAVASLAAAIFMIVLYLVIPSDSARGILGILSMLVILLSGFLVAILTILGIIEVITSKNGTGYKAIWALVMFFFGILGFAAYYFIARRDLK